MEALLNTMKWSIAVGGATLMLTVLKPLLDKRYSARWRYGVWLAMAFLLILAPVSCVLPQTAIEPPLIIEVPRAAVPVNLGGNQTVQPSGGGFQPDTPAAVPMEQVPTGLWLTGAALVLLYHLAGTWRFTRWARRWSLPAGEEALQVYEKVCREMHLKKTPPLCRSTAVDSPMAVGLFQPRLFLPEEELGGRELAFILRHELTHYRRHDLWYKLVLLLAGALHWFNPLIWLLRRESEKDLELTCDDAVILGTDAETRRAYSETLLASIRRQRQRAVLSTHFYGGTSAMKERFRNILGKRGRRRGTAVLAAALAVTVAGGSMFGLRAAASAPEEPPAPAAASAVPAPVEGVPDTEGPEPSSNDFTVPEAGAGNETTPEPARNLNEGGQSLPEESEDIRSDSESSVGQDDEHPPFMLAGYPMVWDEESGGYLFAPGTPEIGGPLTMGDAYRGGPSTSEADQPISDGGAEAVPIVTIQPTPGMIGDFNGYTSTPAVIGDIDHDGVRDTEIEINGQIYPLVWNPDEGSFDPIPGVGHAFNASGDYNGDGVMDSEVQINGERFQITLDPEGGTIYTPMEPNGGN